MSKRTAMIIEDHPVVIEGLRQFLNNSGLFGNCITASTGEEALTYLRAYKTRRGFARFAFARY